MSAHRRRDSDTTNIEPHSSSSSTTPRKFAKECCLDWYDFALAAIILVIIVISLIVGLTLFFTLQVRKYFFVNFFSKQTLILPNALEI
jgi:hypothetical protein